MIIETEPLRHFEFTKPEGQRPLLEPITMPNGHSLVLSLGNKEEGVYHSWSCLCAHCMREDYAICNFSPGGVLTMASWRKFYYVSNGHQPPGISEGHQ